MSQDDWKEFWHKIGTKYPLSHAMMQEFSKKYIQLRQDLYNKDMPEEGQREIPFSVSKQKGQKEPRLTLNEDGVILIMSLMDTMLSQLGRLVFRDDVVKMLETKAREAAKSYVQQMIPAIPQQVFKRCPKCKLDNDSNASYCKNCGRKLEQ